MKFGFLYGFFVMGCETITKTHHIVGFLEGQEIYDLRITQTDAGFLAGQGHIKLHHWQRKTTPLSLGGHFKPVEVLWGEEEITMKQASFSRITQKFQYVDDGLGTLAYLTKNPSNSSYKIQGWSTATNRSIPISGTILQWSENYTTITEILEEKYWWLVFGDKNMIVTYNPNENTCVLIDATYDSCTVELQDSKVLIHLTTNGAIQTLEYRRTYFYGIEDPLRSLSSLEYAVLSPPKRFIYRGTTKENHTIIEMYRGHEKRLINKKPQEK